MRDRRFISLFFFFLVGKTFPTFFFPFIPFYYVKIIVVTLLSQSSTQISALLHKLSDYDRLKSKSPQIFFTFMFVCFFF